MSELSQPVDPSQLIELPAYKPIPKLRNNDRITYVSTLVYEHRGDKPVQVGGDPVHMLLDLSDVEPCSKRIRGGVKDDSWQLLDLNKLGWSSDDKPGFICLENLEGKGLQEKPSDEELAEINDRVIMVQLSQQPGILDPTSMLILPGWPLTFLPSNHTWIVLRCRKGTAQCRVTIFPG